MERHCPCAYGNLPNGPIMIKADQRGSGYIPFPPILTSAFCPCCYPKEKKIKTPLPQRETAGGHRGMTIGVKWPPKKEAKKMPQLSTIVNALLDEWLWLWGRICAQPDSGRDLLYSRDLVSSWSRASLGSSNSLFHTFIHSLHSLLNETHHGTVERA